MGINPAVDHGASEKKRREHLYRQLRRAQNLLEEAPTKIIDSEVVEKTVDENGNRSQYLTIELRLSQPLNPPEK